LAALPLPILHALSRLFAWLAWRVFPYEARVVRDSLTKAFPERSVAEREALRRDFYRGYGDVMVEIIKSASIDGRVLDERMRFGNLATLRAAIAADGPVVLLAAHQCNWEWILLGLSRNGLPGGRGLQASQERLGGPRDAGAAQSLRSPHDSRRAGDARPDFAP
jgi:KDO2-lipid IV(A) lauroyltransferase